MRRFYVTACDNGGTLLGPDWQPLADQRTWTVLDRASSDACVLDTDTRARARHEAAIYNAVDAFCRALANLS